jgi:POT family proton-dependent oligopeptide transporter
MVATSTPAAQEKGFALGGLILAMLLIGLGVGGVRATISPFMSKYILSV